MPSIAFRCGCVLAVVSCFGVPFARGQQEPNNEFGVWGSFSSNSPTVYGSRGHVRFGALAFRYGRVVRASPRLRIEYTLDVEPVEIVHQNSYVSCFVVVNGVEKLGFCASGHETVYGGGVSPFGWKFNWRPSRAWQPMAALTGGFIATTHPAPWDIPMGTRFNFTFDFQAGIERYNRKRNRAWTFAYKLQHISNASRTNVNPGTDLNVFLIGYSFFR